MFDGGKRVTYGKLRTNPNINIVGTNENFLASNGYTIAEGRNFNEADIELARSVVVIGTDVQKRIFPVEDPIGKLIKINEKNFTVIGVLAEKGSSSRRQSGCVHCWCQLPGFSRDYGRREPHRERGDPIHVPAILPEDFQHGDGFAMRIARALKPGDGERFRSVHERFTCLGLRFHRGR